MSLFYYRAWAGVESNGPGGVRPQLTPADAFYYTRSGILLCKYTRRNFAI